MTAGAGAFLQYELAIAIWAFGHAIGAEVEINPRVAKRTAITVAGDDIVLDFNRLRWTWQGCHSNPIQLGPNSTVVALRRAAPLTTA